MSSGPSQPVSEAARATSACASGMKFGMRHAPWSRGTAHREDWPRATLLVYYPRAKKWTHAVPVTSVKSETRRRVDRALQNIYKHRRSKFASGSFFLVWFGSVGQGGRGTFLGVPFGCRLQPAPQVPRSPFFCLVICRLWQAVLVMKCDQFVYFHPFALLSPL